MALSSLLLSGCATVKIPNVGESGYSQADDEKRLQKRSEEFVEEIAEGDLLYPDLGLETYLNRLAMRLLPEEVKKENLKITVKVIKDPTLNAFALPNGYIYIHTGMLAAIDNEAQLATLLGHEMTHILHRHAVKQFRSLTNKSAFFAVLQAPLAYAGGDLASLAAQVTFISSVYGFSRELEDEADDTGFAMIRTDGYDPAEAVKLFEHLEQFIKDEELKLPFFFSTHPNVVARKKNYQKLIAKSPPAAATEQRVTGDMAYQPLTKPVVLDNVMWCFQKGMFKTAERHIQNFLQRYPHEAAGYYLKGELFRQRQDFSKKEKKRDKTKDFPEALAAYEQAIALDQNWAPAYQGRALVYQKQGNIPEAKAAFKKYLEINPNVADKAYVENFLSTH